MTHEGEPYCFCHSVVVGMVGMWVLRHLVAQAVDGGKSVGPKIELYEHPFVRSMGTVGQDALVFLLPEQIRLLVDPV